MKTSNNYAEYEVFEEVDDGTPDWYEKIAEILKKLTYPISGALELARRLGILPDRLKNANFQHIGSKVRNVIDGIVTTLKVFDGKLTKTQALEELKNNEAGFFKTIIDSPLPDLYGRMKPMFGKVGSYIKDVVQEVVTTVVPAIREKVAEGAKKIGNLVASGFNAVKEKLLSIFGKRTVHS